MFRYWQLRERSGNLESSRRSGVNGASKQVNNITLHCDNPSKLCLGELKNKKENDIIKVSIGPKFGFVINISEKIAKSHPPTHYGPPLGFTTGGWKGLGFSGSSRRSGAMVRRNQLIIPVYTAINLPSYA